MHERKALMASLADGFVASAREASAPSRRCSRSLTWSQLGIHQKPVGLVDVEGYWTGLLGLLRHAVQEGFVRARSTRRSSWSRPRPAALLDRFAAWRATGVAAHLARRDRDLIPREPALHDRPARGAPWSACARSGAPARWPSRSEPGRLALYHAAIPLGGAGPPRLGLVRRAWHPR